MRKRVELGRFDNSWYNPGRGGGLRLIWYFTNLIFFQSYFFPVYGLKTKILRLFGAEVGKNLVIKPSVNVKYPWNLKIGNDVWIGENVWIDSLAQVTIGSDVCISQGAMLLTGNHDYKKSTFDLMLGEIVLEDGVWVGAQSTVCPGVHCRSHSILSVGSVASKDLEEYAIYQGIPAVKVRERVID
ncbi:WcaF family extracellular polysaccharide biosynthesis acetyltransferase [Geomonas subterranea]|uniref:WcaF family extracellular polysaccharide biosynthesis acetyltransferase n=1 Tax=Geomonas subterranea TaxID=2847989 RepID=A0ABX8LIN1_9BACT|nr:WcaF family extracellular polysaccharide biosynthesis acetyltransferase [Geomonas subterranea]QXE91547.1 WcaF family extracellular polysaccharide biosynthesis acetyltransferase [Geomonas subterranea]QXM10364.1 WcaF family extracellular polysaccharide biosynthesis acetyltransferase [Geomonas subterranea]